MAHNENNHWERIEKVIQWRQTNVKQFAEQIGLSRPDLLYNIKSGKNGISRRLASVISDRFADIDMTWLLTGTGEMFNASSPMSEYIEYYECDLESNIRNVANIEPNDKLRLPCGTSTDFAMLYKGLAMGDLTPPNSVVMLKRVKAGEIIFGNEYLVQTRNIAVLRILRQAEASGEGQNNLRLVAINRKQFDDTIIERRDIEVLYKVTAKLIINY